MTQPQASDAHQARAMPRSEVRGAPRGSRENGCLLALQFLTVVPAGPKSVTVTDRSQIDMGRALPWFPCVGALLGACVAALNWALEPVFSRSLRDVIAIAALLLVTGMLHFDGFVDCCDAL